MLPCAWRHPLLGSQIADEVRNVRDECEAYICSGSGESLIPQGIVGICPQVMLLDDFRYHYNVQATISCSKRLIVNLHLYDQHTSID